MGATSISVEDSLTIAALATAPTSSALAVIRVSGPESGRAIKALFRSKKDPVTTPRLIVYGEIIDYETKKSIDKSLCFYMPGPNSFTGEDTVEFQFHGSPLLIQKVLRSLYSFGITPAEPGEFTKRAFINGKLDLIQAEAISDLIHATSEKALQAAGEQLDGRLSDAIEEIGEPLRNILAEIEASIDFSDEDIAPQAISSLITSAQSAYQSIEKLLATYEYGSILRDGFRILLCGKPNVGKSSIFNTLVGRERAIVTEVSGTTRDLIEEEVTLGGYRFVFCDSAGVRETDDTVEKIGVALTRERMQWADLILLVADATEDNSHWQEIKNEVSQSGKKIWMVVNKIDKNPSAIGNMYCDSTICEQNFYVSAKTKSGIEALKENFIQEVSQRLLLTAESNLIVTNERHRHCLMKTLKLLKNVLANSKNQLPPEIISLDLRAALEALNEIIGKTYTEDILGRIFSRFCIGK